METCGCRYTKEQTEEPCGREATHKVEEIGMDTYYVCTICVPHVETKYTTITRIAFVNCFGPGGTGGH